MLATGIVWNNLCMVKLLRYTQETGMLEYQHTAYEQKLLLMIQAQIAHFTAIHALEMELQNNQSLHLF